MAKEQEASKATVDGVFSKIYGKTKTNWNKTKKAKPPERFSGEEGKYEAKLLGAKTSVSKKKGTPCVAFTYQIPDEEGNVSLVTENIWFTDNEKTTYDESLEKFVQYCCKLGWEKEISEASSPQQAIKIAIEKAKLGAKCLILIKYNGEYVESRLLRLLNENDEEQEVPFGDDDEPVEEVEESDEDTESTEVEETEEEFLEESEELEESQIDEEPQLEVGHQVVFHYTDSVTKKKKKAQGECKSIDEDKGTLVVEYIRNNQKVKSKINFDQVESFEAP